MRIMYAIAIFVLTMVVGYYSIHWFENETEFNQPFIDIIAPYAFLRSLVAVREILKEYKIWEDLL